MTRIVKDAQERKDEILDIADKLFKLKGFDQTSIADILNETKIARGTLYYHFKSKEEIMDALIDRYSQAVMTKAETIATDKSIPVLVRFFATINSLNMNDIGGENIVDYVNRPQNALMREKANRIQLQMIPPLLTEIIRDGIAEGIFQTDFPYETVEMLVAYAVLVFDDSFLPLSDAEKKSRSEAIIYNLERLLGAKAGTFDEIKSLLKR